MTFARAWLYYVSSYGRPVDYYTNGQIQKCKHPEDTTWLTYAVLPTSSSFSAYVRTYVAYIYTVWKFHDFSIFQILREINFGDFASAKSAISTHFEALNFDFYGFLHFLKAKIYQKDKTQSSKNDFT